MNTLINVIFELSINILECFIIINFVSNFLGYKYVGIKKLIGFTVGVSFIFIYVIILNKLTDFEGIGILISVIILFCYCVVFTKGSTLSKAFASAATFIIILLINMIVLTSISYITQINVITLMSEASVARYVTVIITKIIFFFITRILLIIKNKKDFFLNYIEWVALICIAVISILISVFIIEILINNPFSERDNLFVLLSMFGIVVINIVTYYLLLKMSRDNNQRLNYTILEQQYKYQKKHNDDVKELYNNISKTKHDMKNHFICIIGMIEQNQKQHALNYIQDIIKQKVNIGPKYIETKNEVVNYILNSKLEICTTLGIDTKYCITGNLDNISEIDICILLGNILDNAIEACESCTFPKIIIDIHSSTDYTQIIIGNTINKSILKNNPMFTTSKKENINHGYGIINIKEIVSKYNGSINYYEKNEMIYCDVMI